MNPVHPELQALADGYYQNPQDTAYPGIIADWLDDHNHPMADTYRWYLNHGKSAVMTGYSDPEKRTVFSGVPNNEEGNEHLRNMEDGWTGLVNRVFERGGEPLGHLFHAALSHGFRPNGPLHPQHEEGYPLFAAQHEMAALGADPRTTNVYASQANPAIIARTPHSLNGPEGRHTIGDTDAHFHLATASFLNRHADNLFTHQNGTVMTKHQLSRGSLRERALHLAKSSPLWVPQESAGNEADTGYIGTPQSSWIAGVKYTPERGAEMTVKHGGKNYAYPGLNLAMFRRWVKAKSPGKWWWRNVGYPLQNSRWTGPVHPLFADGRIDGPPTVSPMSSMNHHEALAMLREGISPHATMAHLGALTGWLPGTTASFRRADGSSAHGSVPYLRSDVTGPNGAFLTSHSILPKGAWGQEENAVENDHIRIPNLPNSPFRGASGATWLRQIRAAYELGIPRVHFHAAWEPNPLRGPAYSGGLHWPMMGANGYLPESYLATVPPGILKDVNMRSRGRFNATPLESRTFEDFFRSPLARNHYMDNPIPHVGFIDTSPGSYSRKAIERHVNEKAMANGLGPAIPDSQMEKMPLHFARLTRYHPMTEHLLATGSLHPDFFDQYFEN